MKTPFALLFLSVLALTLMAFTLNDSLPDGWIKAGSDPAHYEMGVDGGTVMEGSVAAYIESLEGDAKGFGTLMQSCSAAEFKGSKVKFTGYLKTENVSAWAGLWLRVDGREGGKPLSFDNMQDRALKGTADWTYCEIILEVPENSHTLNFGALLVGNGKIWFDALKFEKVPDDAPSTAKPDTPLLKKPTNINFED